jgi:hypothetical protein
MTPTTSTKTSIGTSIGAALVLVAALAGLAFAQTAGDAAQPPAPPAAAPAPSAADARKACSAALNADPAFAAEIVKIADERAALKRDADTVAAHVDANQKIQRNERHVIYAYAAMWVIAAAFVIFLWRRQRGLESEILHLRRELDAAAAEGTKAPT